MLVHFKSPLNQMDETLNGEEKMTDHDNTTNFQQK